MNINDIAFPNLGIYLHNVPKSFSVFGISIALYGVVIAVGMVAGILIAAHVAKKTDQNPDMYWDFALYALVVSVIFARIYYVVFEWDYYKDNLRNIFNLRQGGLAIYGGVIGAFLTVFVYARIKHYSPFLLGDTGVVGLILGEAIGRWGNFFNREVFGEYTNNLVAMQLPVGAVRSIDISENLYAHLDAATDSVLVHPTFLYESLWNLLIFALLLLLWKKKRFDGEMILLYLGGYGLGRAFIEGIRTDTLFIPHTTWKVSQVLAVALVIFSVLCDVIVRIRLKKKEVSS